MALYAYLPAPIKLSRFAKSFLGWIWHRYDVLREPGNSRLIGAAGVIAMMTVGVRGIALVREIAIARYFGTSDEVDAYLVAFSIPNFVVQVLAGSLQAAFIPAFIKILRREGQSEANRLLNSVVLATSTLLGSVLLVSLAGAPWIIKGFASGFSPQKMDLAVSLYYYLSPIIVLSGLVTIWGGVLNALEQFALAAALPGVATFIALVFLWTGASSLGIYSLAMGYTFGFFAQLALLGFMLRRRGYLLRPRWSGWDAETRSVMREYFPMIVGQLLLGSVVMVEQFMAASLDAGSVASLGYASRLILLVNNVCAMALGTAVLPRFSALVADANWSGLRKLQRSFQSMLFVVGGVAAVGLYVGSDTLTDALYVRGNFTDHDAQVVATLQRILALQLPFFAAGIFLVRLISALQANKFLMWGSLISLVVNLGLNYLLRERLGLNGVALANSIMYILSFCYLAGSVSWLLRHREASSEKKCV